MTYSTQKQKKDARFSQQRSYGMPYWELFLQSFRLRFLNDPLSHHGVSVQHKGTVGGYKLYILIPLRSQEVVTKWRDDHQSGLLEINKELQENPFKPEVYLTYISWTNKIELGLNFKYKNGFPKPDGIDYYEEALKTEITRIRKNAGKHSKSITEFIEDIQARILIEQL